MIRFLPEALINSSLTDFVNIAYAAAKSTDSGAKLYINVSSPGTPCDIG